MRLCSSSPKGGGAAMCRCCAMSRAAVSITAHICARQAAWRSVGACYALVAGCSQAGRVRQAVPYELGEESRASSSLVGRARDARW